MVFIAKDSEGKNVKLIFGFETDCYNLKELGLRIGYSFFCTSPLEGFYSILSLIGHI